MAAVRGSGRIPATLLAAFLLLALLALLAAAPAAAHTQLIDSQPEHGATLAKPPRAVALTFSETLQGRGAGFAVTGPQGTTPVTAQIDGATARFPWPPGDTAGDYRVEYRVVSADGHVVDGRLRFTIEGARPTSTPGTATSLPAEPESPDSSTDPSTVPAWLWLLVAGGVAVAAFAVWRARPSDDRQEH